MIMSFVSSKMKFLKQNYRRNILLHLKKYLFMNAKTMMRIRHLEG